MSKTARGDNGVKTRIIIQVTRAEHFYQCIRKIREDHVVRPYTNSLLASFSIYNYLQSCSDLFFVKICNILSNSLYIGTYVQMKCSIFYVSYRAWILAFSDILTSAKFDTLIMWYGLLMSLNWYLTNVHEILSFIFLSLLVPSIWISLIWINNFVSWVGVH